MSRFGRGGCLPRVRTGDEPVRESQLARVECRSVTSGGCAPATSRCGSLNPAGVVKYVMA